MKDNKQVIKEGITLHKIETNRFKTNLIACFLTNPLDRQTITWDAVITSVLRRGTSNMPSQEIISKRLENMYGAAFDCGIEKTGDNHVIKFYLESLNDNFLPQRENNLQNSIDTLLEIVLEPLIEANGFKAEYVKGEKDNIKQIIEGKMDDKAQYALNRCIEEMYQGSPYGLYKYGYIEDLDQMNPQNLYAYYQKLISQCKIDIFVSGDITEDIDKIVKQNEQIQKIEARKSNFIVNNEKTENKKTQDTNIVTESMNITQGKLILGLNIEENTEDSKFAASVYNAILGGGPTSKLFQNVREKASLAYSAGSSYIRQKNSIFIRAGIEIPNYDKALDIIKVQLEDIKKGNFTSEELKNAKESITSAVRNIPDEQDTQISYYLGQELAQSNVSLEEYIQKTNAITKEQIIEIASKIKVDTIYFLKD